MALTRRQKQVLDFLVLFINRKGYSPSFEETASSLKLSSIATVHKHLDTLERCLDLYPSPRLPLLLWVDGSRGLLPGRKARP